MKKTIFTSNIVKAIFIFILLLFVFTKNEEFEIRVIISCFLMLTACYMAENLCDLFNKQKLTKIFHKLFIVIFLTFGIGFLILWSYNCIKTNNYFPLLITIPFWLLIIYIIRRHLLGIKQNPKKAKKVSKINARIIISCFLVFCVLASGTVCLIIGIKDTYSIKNNTKNYLTTTGYFKDYEIYDSYEKLEHNSKKTYTTYSLIYEYEIDGKKYTIKTDYGSGFIPSINSTREIKYNPNIPSEAVLVGTTRNSGLIYFGAFFILGGMAFVLVFFKALGIFDKVKIDVLGIYVGIVFLVIGIGIIAIQMGTTSSLIEVIKVMKFWILIPIMFIIVGGFQTIRCLFFERLEIKNKEDKKDI